MPDPYLATVRKRFIEFGRLGTHGIPSLYTYLASQIAEDRFLLALASHAQVGQPQPNMLLGAVHYLLLKGYSHPLKEYYASIITNPLPVGPACTRHFADFCKRNENEIEKIISTRFTQTNEVGRSALLLPAFETAVQMFADREVAFIEVGASAGLNLNWPFYKYNFGAKTPDLIPSATDLHLSVETRGPLQPPTASTALEKGVLAMRIGIEQNPVDLNSEEDLRWLKALTWPEDKDRMARLETAIVIADQQPPAIIQGDALTELPRLLRTTPENTIPIIYHTFVTYQFDDQEKARFDSILKERALASPLLRIAIEWTAQQAPTIELDLFFGNNHTNKRLAECNPHGRWIKWLTA